MDTKKDLRLVQTRIPVKLLNWLEKEAKKEGISSAAFVRRLIMRAEQKAEVL